MKYVLAFIFLSFTTVPPEKKCTVYAAVMHPEPHYIDSIRVSVDSVGIATIMMLKVKGAEYTAIKCDE